MDDYIVGVDQYLVVGFFVFDLCVVVGLFFQMLYQFFGDGGYLM